MSEKRNSEAMSSESHDPKKRRSRWGQDASESVSGPSDKTSREPAKGSSHPAVSSSQLAAAAAAAKEALERAKLQVTQSRMTFNAQKGHLDAVRHGRLAAQAAAAHLSMLPPQRAPPLVLDKFGREIDAEGKVIPVRPHVMATLKINQSNLASKGRMAAKPLAAASPEPAPAWWDPNLNASSQPIARDGSKLADEAPAHPVRRGFRLLAQGTFESAPPPAAALTPTEPSRSAAPAAPSEVPEIEWWDAIIAARPELVSHLIEHPPPLRGQLAAVVKTARAAAASQSAVNAALTPAERKKLRRLRRQEKTRELQDKIRMGLLKAPPPKVKMRNLMLVLGDEAVAGPSGVERAVKGQVQKRLADHQQRNEERKISPEERRAKQIAKWTKPCEPLLHAAAYKVSRLVDRRHLFKISRNADQLHLTGCCLWWARGGGAGAPSLVVAEGSKKAINRFDRLMLCRINWAEATAPVDLPISSQKNEEAQTENMQVDTDEEAPLQDRSTDSSCIRMWRGTVVSRLFSKWNTLEISSAPTAEAFLKDRNAIHYWEMVSRHRSVELDL